MKKAICIFGEDIDSVIKTFGIKYVFVESGRLSIINKCENCGLNPEDYPTVKFWCELSWGNGDEDKYEFAFNDFGDTLGDAVINCLDRFCEYVKMNCPEQVEAAKEFGIYNRIIGA